MYGWRGRIGHVYPAVVAETYFTDFFRVVPEGVTLALTSLSIQAIREEDLKRSEAQLDQAIGFLAKRKVDCIIVGGGPIFREKGIAGELEFIDRVTRSTGIPTTTSQVATVDAVRHLGIKRLAIATPYPDDQNRKIAEYWRASGTKTMERAISEYRSGKPLYDAILLNANVARLVSKEGMLVKYDSPSAAQFAKEGVDPVLGPSYRNVIIGVIYNKSMLSPAEAPKTLEDLGRPQFKGKIAMPIPAST